MLVVAWDIWFPTDSPPDAPIHMNVEGPSDAVPRAEFESEFARLGYWDPGYFVVGDDGLHTITVTAVGADPSTEPGLAVGVFVLPPEAFDVLDAFGIKDWSTGYDQRQDEWHEAAVRAMLEGLRAVAGHVEEPAD